MNRGGVKARVFQRSSYPESVRVAGILRKETVGGALLLLATVLALIAANSPWASAYFGLRDYTLGTEIFGIHLTLTVGKWASDGLLAIFFFVAGLELKREFVAGDLRSFDRAVVPIAAAAGGVLIPALLYTLMNAQAGPEALNGWAIPTATDIAFALAVLAVISTHLPDALRTFLLTLAVVDDLIAITIIAVFYPENAQLQYLLFALVPLALFAWAVQKRVRSWYLLLPLAVLTWVLVHESGVHATVAGVLLAFMVPVRRKDGAKDTDGKDCPGLAEHLEHRFRPLSAGVVVPIFAFFSAGVAVGGISGFTSALSDSVAVGTIVALVVGKAVGICAATFIVTRTTRATFDEGLSWLDIVGLSLLAGIGFTVSLLISELAFEQGSPHIESAKVAILTASVISALLATVLLRARNRHYRAIEALETTDANRSGIPDAYEQK